MERASNGSRKRELYGSAQRHRRSTSGRSTFSTQPVIHRPPWFPPKRTPLLHAPARARLGHESRCAAQRQRTATGRRGRGSMRMRPCASFAGGPMKWDALRAVSTPWALTQYVVTGTHHATRQCAGTQVRACLGGAGRGWAGQGADVSGFGGLPLQLVGMEGLEQVQHSGLVLHAGPCSPRTHPHTHAHSYDQYTATTSTLCRAGYGATRPQLSMQCRAPPTKCRTSNTASTSTAAMGAPSASGADAGSAPPDGDGGQCVNASTSLASLPVAAA